MLLDVFQLKLLLLVYFSGWMAGGTIEVIIMLSQLSTKLKLKLKLSLAKSLADLPFVFNTILYKSNIYQTFARVFVINHDEGREATLLRASLD